MGHRPDAIFADRGYFSELGNLIRCEQAGIVPYVPKPLTSVAKFEGKVRQAGLRVFARQGRLPLSCWRTPEVVVEPARRPARCCICYWTTKCRDLCRKAEHGQGAQDQALGARSGARRDAQRQDQAPQAMAIRRQTVEHVFGTIKAWMGATHFLTKTLKRVRTEMSLQVLAYNMKRVIAILGTHRTLAAILG